ncbi:MAG: hypothetical protein M1833_001795 [Piccolia ochrophora]|nr:MAG: hypothetical protein M1833_001795 [Piccolia ochrophora]
MATTALLRPLLVLVLLFAFRGCCDKATDDQNEYRKIQPAVPATYADGSPAPGWPPLESTQYACLSSANDVRCMPTGTYIMTAEVFSFDLIAVDSLRFQEGSTVNFPESTVSGGQIFDKEQTGDNHRFLNVVISEMIRQPNDKKMVIVVPTDPACACFFLDEFWANDWICLGVGEGMLPAAYIRNIQSIALHGQARVLVQWDFGNGTTQTLGFDNHVERLAVPFPNGLVGKQGMIFVKIVDPKPPTENGKA